MKDDFWPAKAATKAAKINTRAGWPIKKGAADMRRL